MALLSASAETPTVRNLRYAVIAGTLGYAIYCLGKARQAEELSGVLNDALTRGSARTTTGVGCQPGTTCPGRVTVEPVQDFTGRVTVMPTANFTVSHQTTPTRAVAHAQVSLFVLGYDLGPMGVDGRIGPKTRAAIQNFQRSRSLPVTGTLDAETTRLLDLVYWA